MPTKAIGYVRVSTDKQAGRGVSLEAQVEKVRAMATVHDVELLDVPVDAGESAKDLDRSGMVRILEMVQTRAVGMVIVAKTTRKNAATKKAPAKAPAAKAAKKPGTATVPAVAQPAG